MTRLARRASMLVAFYLLTSTATAYAECAWVLWARTLTEATGDPEWKSQGAYTDRGECAGAAGAPKAASGPFPVAWDPLRDRFAGNELARLDMALQNDWPSYKGTQ